MLAQRRPLRGEAAEDEAAVGLHPGDAAQAQLLLRLRTAVTLHERVAEQPAVVGERPAVVVAAQRAGVSIAFSYDQTINPTEYFAVPKGTQQKDAAMRFIDFTLRPDRQAEFAEIMAYTPTKIAALDLLDAETKKKLPDLSNPNSVIFNDDWWADHLIELEKRFKEWML